VTAISVFQFSQALQVILCSDSNKISSNYFQKLSESLSSVIIILIFRLFQMWTPDRDLHHLLKLPSHTKNTLHCSTTVAYHESLFLLNHCSVSFQFCSLKFAAAKFCIARLMPQHTMKFPVFCSLITSKFNYHW